MSRSRTIFNRLPALYRNRGGDFLKRFIRVADEGASEFHARLSLEERALDDLADVLRPLERDRVAGVSSPLREPAGLLRCAGTAAAVLRWLERAGPRPEIWPGLMVSVESPTRIRFSRTGERSVVVAWSGEDVESPPDEVMIPVRLIPVGCRVQAVWLSKPPKPRPVFPGSVLVGREIAIRTDETGESGKVRPSRVSRGVRGG